MRWTSLLLVAVFAAATQPAATIRGKILDPAGRAAPNVPVQIIPGGARVTSDAAGEFAFSAVAPGTYKLVTGGDLFEPASSGEIQIGEAGAPGLIAIRLQKLRINRVQMDVVGEEPAIALREIPGSAFLVSRQELEDAWPMDANEALRAVPGVHIREDSGPVGMRLNIGIRGLNPDRSRTLLVLEDGLPLALAPYGEPEMYYSPPIDRMSRVELLKGSGSIVYGPQTIGGVLNFITPDPPLRPQGEIELTGGQRGFFTGQASYGGTAEGAGWYFNLLRKQGDGWRDHYFDINDFTSKLNVNVSGGQRLGIKLGFYDERSNSTYLGLTESQFRRDPGFNAVPDDLLKVRRYSGSLLHQFVASPRALVSTTLFGYTTARNWRRQDFDRTRRTGVNYRSIAGDPSIPGDAIFLRDSAGNNNREFDVAGIESRLSFEHGAFGLRHHLETGMRYLYEEHRDRRVDGVGHMALSGVIRSDETRYGRALSGFLQNRLHVGGRMTVTPGVRVESYDYTRWIHRQPVGGVPADVNIRGGDSVLKAIPGAGVTFQLSPALTLFGGAHRGFAPPRVKDAITPAGVPLELDAELSWNYEAGGRLQLGRGVKAEATLFTLDFENQIIPAAQSGGATTTLINAGETLHRGAEFSIAADWSRLVDARAGVWTEFRYTYLPVARFTNGVYEGNRLPYAPRNTVGLRVGYRHRTGISVHTDGAYVGDQFGDNEETKTGSADGTTGRLPGYWVWNASASREFHRERWTLQPFVAVKNLANRIYISSRAPLGIQPGMFRQINAGVKVRF